MPDPVSASNKPLNEQETRSRYITPALTSAGWNLQTQIREEVRITDGQVIVRGSLHTRAEAKRADYVLFHKPNIPLAVVEAKDTRHSVSDGLQQAIDYAVMWDIPFAASSNGKAFVFHDSTAGPGEQVEYELPLDQFPSPQELWARLVAYKGLTDEQEAVVGEDYYLGGDRKSARYYQAVAVNRVIEAVAGGQKRLLLVMATGTGKTFTAFQIIWRLRHAGRAKRVLFLVDRNVLADQALINDFQPFGSAMTKITKRTIDKSYEIYLSLYQAVTDEGDPDMQAYREFSPDFFDLVVVDECHRGSAAADSSWRQVLEYFQSAAQIGLTATPKETRDVSNIDYFGEPVYIYSLRQGIEDGFLAPFKVVRLDLDKDLAGWRPSRAQQDRYGELIDDRIYNQADFDRTLVLTERTKLVAEKITDYLKSTNRYDKTIVFCEDIDHAERMRQALVNANADIAAANPKYVVRITGDNQVGKAELDNFIDPEQTFPVIATTSKLLTTGVDAQTCKVIVLDQQIQSLTEFKQIIGRGTRIREDYGKLFFTILDFRRATELFADPDFDGEPVQILEDPRLPPPDDEGSPGGDGDAPDDTDDPEPRRKFVVDDVEVTLIGERVQYYSKDGKLVTESLRDYTRSSIYEQYASLDDFLKRWRAAARKQAVVEELEKQGVLLDALAEDVGRDYDPFDLICHVVFDQPPLTRRERAEAVRKRDYFTRYGDQARAVLEALLDKYADEGVESIEDLAVLRIRPFDELGAPMELLDAFGGRDEYLTALRELERQLYTA